ncbi:hypothetical protein ACWEWG_38200 [Streptomyces sp. NPDC003758]|uniref:Uncharacterized protein n=1 Tax=Streptomyces cynarae TaxID=2981134 RepID=A0ABY6EBE8_9ACTN|nr:hypothetical protein [Streptomyces cynarae]UXY23994.1 hypothetical protein N8I84_38800 [Streptomyces cynarae]
MTARQFHQHCQSNPHFDDTARRGTEHGTGLGTQPIPKAMSTGMQPEAWGVAMFHSVHTDSEY